MLAGANIIYGSGMLDMGMTFSYEQYVVDNEFVRMLRGVLRGVPVNDQSMAVDVIKSVGAGGHFLMEDHTLENMDTAHVIPNFIDRNSRDAWEQQGKQSLISKGRMEAINILENHKPDRLPEDVAAYIRTTIEEIEKELGIIND